MWVTIASVSGGVISLVVIAVMGVRTHRKFERHFVTCVWGSRPIEAARVASHWVLSSAARARDCPFVTQLTGTISIALSL
jgi:hypothetical protein